MHLTQHLKGTGYHYAPDPSSQGACTIGGNVATNSGGPHTLKYGVTVNHVLGVGSRAARRQRAATRRTGGRNARLRSDRVVRRQRRHVRHLHQGHRPTHPRPGGVSHACSAVFETVRDATTAISEIIGAGIVPAALEMMDQGIIEALEAAFHFGFPLDAGAVLLIEVDGLETAVDGEADPDCRTLPRNPKPAKSAGRTPTEERQLLWKCRKQAFGAIGRLSPSYCTQDGVVPRTQLPEILEFITDCSQRHDVRIVNVFHAGDGNIHPILLFDERDPEQIQRVMRASDEILAKCIELGGSVTGEHGIGVEKISFMSQLFTENDLAVMADVGQAFNPDGRCSPQKMLPTAGACGMEHIPRSKPGRKAAM